MNFPLCNPNIAQIYYHFKNFEILDFILEVNYYYFQIIHHNYSINPSGHLKFSFKIH